MFHKTHKLFFLTCLFFQVLYCSPVLSQEPLSEKLKPLTPFIGKTWKAAVSTSKDNEPIYDISKWERVLNGKAVRILHSVNDGAYGGETIFVWNEAKQKIVYYYFTTAGFFTNGTVEFENRRMVTHEFVTGNEEGITEVKAISRITKDGEMEVLSSFFKKGEWSKESRALYLDTPDAMVIFK